MGVARDARPLSSRETEEERCSPVVQPRALNVEPVAASKAAPRTKVDSDDHNIHIYYPMSAGGGCKRLFRKIGNQSSKYEAELNDVRREGSYLYEEFVASGVVHGPPLGRVEPWRLTLPRAHV